jgi:hypothetical protein
MYSHDSIRWYCNNTNENLEKIEAIISWWKQLNNQTIKQFNISKIQIDKMTGAWQPSQINSLTQVLINDPDLQDTGSTALISYKNGNGSVERLDAVVIDLDKINQTLFVWTTTPSEVIIFSK